MMKKIKQVLIVEGRHDYARLKSFLEADILITGGTSLDQNFKNELQKYLELGKEFIILTDADTPGEYIRNEITKIVPNAKHVFLRAKDSKYKNKVGIEHASKETILKALENIISFDSKQNNLTALDLFNFGLTAKLNSKELREFVTAKLNIGKTNGKTLLNRLNGLGISKSQLQKIVKEFKDEKQ